MKKIFILIFISILIIIKAPNVYAAENSVGDSAKLQSFLVRKEDSRIKVLKAFLAKYQSPLVLNANELVSNADLYNIDWRLVVAISGVESTFGLQIPYNSYNGWGWGVYGNNVIYFSSWQEGIETVSRGLRENFIDKIGTDNVYAIGRTYAASPTWASKVEYFIEKIDQFKSQNEIGSLSLSL